LHEINPMPNLNHETIELAFIAVTGLAVFFQTIILFAIFLAVKKATKSLKEEVEDLRTSVMPVIFDSRDVLSSTRALLTRVGPKLEQSVDDLSAAAGIIKTQAADVEVSARDILVRVRNQTTRVDAMVTNTLNSVDRASGYVLDAVNKPVRQISGLLASIKAIVESLRHSETALRTNHYNDDQDFI